MRFNFGIRCIYRSNLFQEQLLEAVTILQESAKILAVEPDMKNLLEKRLETLSNYLDLD